MANKILYIVRGVPGSGKSTMAHKLSNIVVEADDFMMENGKYKYDPKKVTYCHKKCFETVEKHLKNGEPTVAVANTFIKKSLYEPYVELANKYGYKVIIRKADGNYKNIHGVPKQAIDSMKKRFQECIMEGFDIEEILESTKLVKTSNPGKINIVAMGTVVGYIMVDLSKDNNTLTIGYIEITPHMQQIGLAKVALKLLKKEFNPSVVRANITNNASLKAFCSVFGRPSMCYNANGEDVEDPSEGISDVPTETSSIDGEYNTCIWNIKNNINESVEPKFNNNFKKWFGNSKVVDENGKPLAVYHGWNKEFEEFILQDKDVKGVKCAFFSSDVNTAASYSEFGNVRDFYLRIENPLIYDANFSQYYIGKDSNHIMVALNKAKKGNYDGVIIKNIRDDSYQEYEEGYEIPYSTTYIVFNPNQIKSVKNNGNWSLEADNINEEKEVIEERLFPELSDRKYNELLWFTSPNMTANAYTKFFGKEMIADRIPAKYLVSIGSRDQEMLNDLVLKHKRLRDAGKVKPIADYNDFEEFVKDLNANKYLSRKDKSNVAKSGANIIKSFGDWDMYAITSWPAAKKYGAGTTWCVTTGNTDSYFNKYVGGGESDSFGGYNTRKLFFVINPEKDRKFAISVSKTVTHDWYTSSIEFYNESDDVFYEYDSTVLNLNLKDNISDKFNENNTDVDVDEAEYYGEDESFFIDIMKYIIDEFKMNKDEVIEDIERLRKDFKQKLGISESANNSTNMTWEEFVEKVGRENEFDGSVVISKHDTSIVIRQSGRILVKTGKTRYKKAYSNLKTFDEIYNMLVEKGFIEEQILSEAVNQHSLYHGCDLAYAVSMMIDNAMRGETIANINGKKYQGNSLTRSLQFAKDWQDDRWDGYGDVLNQFWVVLELNKERLKTKYKVLPYNYWEDYFGKDYEHTIDRNGYGDQYEEFVVGRISNLRNYLDDVYLSDECIYGEYAEILAIVKRELELRGEDYSESDIEEALQQLGIDKPSPDDLNKIKIDESIKSVNREFADTKLITSPSELNQYLKTNTESRVVYDKENKWFLVGNDETSIHIHLLDDAIKDGYYQSFDCNNGEELYDNHPHNFVLFRTTSDETNEDKLYDDRYKYCYVYNDYCVFDRNLDFEETPLYNLLGEPSDFNYIGDINETKLNENYDGMPMVYPNPTYSEFHDIMRRFTTTGKLSAIIDGDDIYCWDSYLKHHDTMIRYIENKMDIKISDNAIWVRFKEPNKVWVSGAYFNDYDNDELEDLETQDFEEELKYNPVIRKYFPKGVKVVRYDRLDEEIAFGKMFNDEMITILKNPTRNELKKNDINRARIVVDDYGNIYFGPAEKYSHAMIVHDLERNNISEFKILGSEYDWGVDVFLYDQTSNTFYYRVDYMSKEEEKEKLEIAKDFLNTSYFNKSFGDFDVQITDKEEPWEK